MQEIAIQSDAASFTSVTGVRWLPRISSAAGEREALAIAQQLGVHELVGRLLVGRGISIDSAQDFLNPTLRQALPDPSHLLDMDRAAARIAKALQAGEHVAVFGDYDVDGATSSALLARYFRALGRELTIYIPDRMREGYGPNKQAFDTLKQQGVKLVITVDCGTVAYEALEHAHTIGLEVIVIDHHTAEPKLPQAVAVVNPNRVDQESECGHLAAVGVSYLLLIALQRLLREQGYFTGCAEPDLLQWLDLVALGTVCDVVPLKGLNRALVAQGLKVMAMRGNPGIRALSDLAQLDEKPNAYHLGFMLGSRINAGGRVGASALGSRLLASNDEAECQTIAMQLDQMNRERQAIESEVLEAAKLQAETQSHEPCIIVSSDSWHEGVIGIVASRLKDSYERPVIVISISDNLGKGSARSVAGADIGAAISVAKQNALLLAGGGHKMAGGFTIETDYLKKFRLFLNERLKKAVADYQLGRCYYYDATLHPQGANLALLDQCEQLSPFGMGNASPRFVLPDVRIVQKDTIKDKHMRLIVSANDGSKARLKAVAFNVVGTDIGNALERAKGPVHLAGQLKRNRWQGYESAQFIIDDVAL